MKRPVRVDRGTDRAERGRCFDTHEQDFPLDEHRGQGRYPAYTPNSNIDSECMQNGVADQMLHIYKVNTLLNFPVYCLVSNVKFYTKLKIRRVIGMF